jgi:hypothetical protein
MDFLLDAKGISNENRDVWTLRNDVGPKLQENSRLSLKLFSYKIPI